MSLDPRHIVNEAAKAADDKKARDIVILDIGDISSVTDYFLICSGNSSTQVKAISENVEEKLAGKGLQMLRKEGIMEGSWILLDYGDLVVHVFQEDERKYYNLERLWGDAKVVDF